MALDSGFARRRAPRNDGVYISGKKKGPLALASGPSLGRKRPRRAAITPKRYRTATICDRAAQSARAFETFPMQNPQGWFPGNTGRIENISSLLQSFK